jgi:hypothetical protein
MKELKRQKHTVKLVYDKLIVDGHPYNPRDDPHQSGGIIVVFKKTFPKCLHFIKSDSEYVQWVEFTKCLNSDMLLGCVYIPPGI